MKSSSELRKLLAQKTWDKEVAIWVGSLASLQDLISGSGQTIDVKQIDLLDLISEHSIPDSDEELGRTLKGQLRSELQKQRSSSTDRRILLVQSTALLSRYDVGLKEFFDWFVGDHAMVILLLDGIPSSTKPLPLEIEIRPKGLIEKLNHPDLAKNAFIAS